MSFAFWILIPRCNNNLHSWESVLKRGPHPSVIESHPSRLPPNKSTPQATVSLGSSSEHSQIQSGTIIIPLIQRSVIDKPVYYKYIHIS